MGDGLLGAGHVLRDQATHTGELHHLIAFGPGDWSGRRGRRRARRGPGLAGVILHVLLRDSPAQAGAGHLREVDLQFRGGHLHARGKAVPFTSPLAGEVGRKPGGGTRTFYQRSKPLFEFPEPNIIDLERQPEIRCDLTRLLGQPGVGDLPQIQHRLVITEQHRFQFRVAIEAQASDDRAVEVTHQPVGEKEGAGPALRGHRAGGAGLRGEVVCGRNLRSCCRAGNRRWQVEED